MQVQVFDVVNAIQFRVPAIGFIDAMNLGVSRGYINEYVKNTDTVYYEITFEGMWFVFTEKKYGK